MRLPRLITDAPRASSRGAGRVFLSRKVGSRTGVRVLGTCPRSCARSRSCHVRFTRSVRVLSRDEFRGGYSVGAASLGILKYQVFLEQLQEVPVGFFDLFADKTPEEPAEAQLTAYVQGRVQGVGFRWWCAGAAKPLGLSGYAENLDDGRVKVIAQGSRASCERLLETLNSGDTAGHVDFVDASFTEPQGTFKGFGTR